MVSINHLLRMKSNHFPLLLLLDAHLTHFARMPCRYFSGWTFYQDFSNFVSNSWDSSMTLSEAIANFTHEAEYWNNNFIGILGKRKKNLMARIRSVPCCLGYRHSTNMLKLKSKLLKEHDIFLEQEYLLWKQKSCSD
ncbi:hypothetical protein V6N13_048310 [Hibiscus sabdariffa]